MIRLTSISPGRVLSDGLRCRQRLSSSSAGLQRYFSAATKDDETPKGIPYSKLTVGVPKEHFPLEKRVAATPEVSNRSALFTHLVTLSNILMYQLFQIITLCSPPVCLQTSQTRL